MRFILRTGLWLTKMKTKATSIDFCSKNEHNLNVNVALAISLIITKSLLSFQYYEMSYGLNIEMHKQVGTIMFFTLFSSVVFCSVRGCQTQEEQLIGCEPNWVSVIGCKAMDLLQNKQGGTYVILCHPSYNCCDPFLMGGVKTGFVPVFW